MKYYLARKLNPSIAFRFEPFEIEEKRIVCLPIPAASREVQEEVGVVLSPNQGKIVKTMLREYFQGIVDVWLFEYDGKVDLSKASTKEVVQARWMGIKDIRALSDKGELQRNLLYFFDGKSLGCL